MRSLKLWDKNKGTTLVELLLYLALFSIVLLIAVDLMIRSGEAGLESQAENSVYQEGNFIINRMEYDIHRAESVSSPVSPGQSSASLWLKIGGQDYIYFVVLNKVQLYINGAWYDLGSSTAYAPAPLYFENVGSSTARPTIKTRLTLRSSNSLKGGPLEKTFETVVGLR